MTDHKLRMSRVEKVFYFLYVFSFVFDFKGQESGGAVIQFIFLSISLSSAFVLLVAPSAINRGYLLSPICKKLITIWFVFLISSLIPLIYFNIPFSQYIRVVTPFVLFAISLLIVIKLYKKGIQFNDIIMPIVWAAIISTIWTPFYYFVILNFSMEEVRFQIISPLIPIIFSFSFVKLFFEKRIDFVAFFILALAVSLIVLSLTRVYLLLIAIVVIMLFMLSKGNVRYYFMKKGFRLSLLGFAVFIVFLPVLESIRPGFLMSWIGRLFAGQTDLGIDITLLARIAEYNGQMQLLFENFISPFIGRGLGSTYVWDETYFYLLSEVFKESNLENLEPWNTGHSLWVYSIYSGGIIFGFLIPIYFILNCYHAAKQMKIALNKDDLEQAKIVVFSTLCIFGFISLSFTSHPFGVRLTGLILGILSLIPILVSVKKHD